MHYEIHTSLYGNPYKPTAGRYPTLVAAQHEVGLRQQGLWNEAKGALRCIIEVTSGKRTAVWQA